MANAKQVYNLVVVAVSLILTISISSSANAQQVCNLDIGSAIRDCLEYVQPLGPKIPPSSACCNTVKGVDMPCVCSRLKHAIEGVKMEKAVYVARYCGVELKPGSQCGIYTVPPPKPAF